MCLLLGFEVDFDVHSFFECDGECVECGFDHAYGSVALFCYESFLGEGFDVAVYAGVV